MEFKNIQLEKLGEIIIVVAYTMINIKLFWPVYEKFILGISKPGVSTNAMIYLVNRDTLGVILVPATFLFLNTVLILYLFRDKK